MVQRSLGHDVIPIKIRLITQRARGSGRDLDMFLCARAIDTAHPGASCLVAKGVGEGTAMVVHLPSLGLVTACSSLWPPH